MLALVLSLFLAGCGSTPKEDFSNQGAEKLYAEAKDDMNSGAWDRAAKTLEKVEARAGGSILAQQAQLDLAYSQWRSNEKVLALATLDRFIKLNPYSPGLDYALYLRGLVNFNDNLGFMGSLAGQALAERDQRASRDAYQAFKQLIEQFPESRYASDAKVRMDYIVNSLAEYEIHVARYYYRRGAFVAAANRAQQVLSEFERSPSVQEALHIMVRSYDRLGLETLRDDTRRVLDKNFPNSRFSLDGEGSTSGGDRPWWRPW